MTDASTPRDSATSAAVGAHIGVLAGFAATLLLSAFLLFALEPLFAKMVLPRLGGAPAVWSIAMVFFQAMLLAGYAYAHALVRLKVGVGLVIHAALMALALLWLPVAIAGGFETPPSSGLPLFVLMLFTASIGVPFLAVAANAPLLQAWFARSGHRHARDPYFLYGASNIGSFAALILYPVLIEPLLAIREQSRIWTFGYVALFAAVTVCGLVSLRTRTPAAVETRADRSVTESAGWRERFVWMGFAFVPSALLVAVTAHLSTNIAAAPFLWVMPLALYLLSFVATFTRHPLLPARAMQLMLPLVLPAAMATFSFPGLLGGLIGIAINLFTLFVVAVVWHSQLFASRPPAVRLTDFYLSMSAGGVLGGVFTSLVAPVAFTTVAEFPLLLGLSILAIPEMRTMLFTPKRLPVTALGAIALAGLIFIIAPPVEHRERNFFGTLSTELSDNGQFRLLMHGTTIHGAEKVSDLALPAWQRPEPLTYYAADGPLAGGIHIARSKKPGGVLSVGIVGLGGGSLACYSEPADQWRFFEIDPAVTRIATDLRYFTFLSSCAPDATILPGDARLTLEREPEKSFDVLVIDAFSSDAIPVHLITQEALRLYATRLAPGGVVLLHISNRFLELGSVVAATAAAEGLAGVRMNHIRPDDEYRATFKTSSEVVALAQGAADLAPYVTAGWRPLFADGSVRPWTDDYSNLVGAMLRLQGLMNTPALTR